MKTVYVVEFVVNKICVNIYTEKNLEQRRERGKLVKIWNSWFTNLTFQPDQFFKLELPTTYTEHWPRNAIPGYLTTQLVNWEKKSTVITY